jgi:hypothetical protein
MAYRATIEVVVCAALLTACGPGTGTTETEDADDTTEGDTTVAPDTEPTGPTETPTDPSMPPGDTTDDPSETDPDTTDTTDPPDPTMGGVALAEQSDADILFVVDNSGSMAEEQAKLAQSIAALVEGLGDINYRIGVTTTDAGNPRCPPAVTTPENGGLVLSSCLDRIDAGEFMMPNMIDVSSACTDVCAKSDAELIVTPTTTDLDTNAVPRKWVEQSGGLLNVEGVADATEALQCYLPQGVVGCGFESHLESMFRALTATKDSGSTSNFGFLREAGVLALVIVSDETDCSFNPDASEIFIDNKVFWNDPQDPAPTSAMCWRAGVACSGSAPTWEECHAESFDLQGEAGASEQDAVLFPISKYIDFVAEIQSQKQMFDPNARVIVRMIAGVPIGYESFDSELVYEDSPEQDFQDAFGIGPGCIVGPPNAPESTAVPPVREREWAEAFMDADSRNLSSICAPDYSGAMAELAASVRAQIQPLCFPQCAADVDPATPIVEPNCQLFENNLITDTRVPIAPCEEVGGEWVVPAGEVVCFAELTDKDGASTPSEIDDMSPVCVSEGFNVEFVIVRTEPRAPGVTLEAVCEKSEDKRVDCPLL